MPHLVVLYTPGLDAETDMTMLCRKLADAMLAVRDDGGRQVFPTGGVRVLAYPAPHAAVADGSGDHGFVWTLLELLVSTSKQQLRTALIRQQSPQR